MLTQEERYLQWKKSIRNTVSNIYFNAMFLSCTRRGSIWFIVKHIVNYLMFLQELPSLNGHEHLSCIVEIAAPNTYRKHEANPGAVIPTAHVQQSSSRQGGIEMNNKRLCSRWYRCLWHLWKLLCILYSQYCVWLESALLSSSQAVVRPPGCCRAPIGHLCARPALLLATCAAEVCSRAWRRVPARAAPHGARRARTARSAARRQLVGCVVLVAVFITGSTEPGSSHR